MEKDDGMPENEDIFGEDIGATTGYKSFDGEADHEMPAGVKPLEEDSGGDDIEEIADEDIKGEEEELEGDPESEDFEEEDEEEEDTVGEIPEEIQNQLKDVGLLRMKAQLADQLEKDPENTIKYLAQRYGIDIVSGKPPAEEKKLEIEEIPQLQILENESMPAYMSRLQKASMDKLLQAVDSLIDRKVGNLSAKQKSPVKHGGGGLSDQDVANALSYLNTNHSDWAVYEKDMIDVLAKHPTYARDVEGLYRAARSQYFSRTKKKQSGKGGEKPKKKKIQTGARNKGGKVTLKRNKNSVLSFDEAWKQATTDARKVGKRR